MADTYLLEWKKFTAEPVFHPVRVVNVTPVDNDGPWVEFEFIGGPMHGQRSGSPFVHIISEKEKGIITAASDDIYLKSEQIKQIRAGCRKSYQDINTSLASFERDLSHLVE